MKMVVLALLAQAGMPLFGQRPTTASGNTDFLLCASGKAAPLYAAATDYPGVLRALNDLRDDITRVTDTQPLVVTDKTPSGREIVVVGTVGKSALINQLVANKKLNADDIAGKWETFSIQVVEKPFKGVDRALVIAGSDKRGTIYGIYEISKQIGVSPWYWWADVPPKKSKELSIPSARQHSGEPAVKYRGIFLNDEEPALGRWAVANYGGFNHKFYEKVFELILRLKGNYLWPAMWWASFNSDDPLNPKIADEYGVVIGTTHHEPMNRAHAEWKTFKGGAWSYDKNEAKLREFWTEGIRRMGDYETLVALGMRGDGDEAMSAETNIALLERIVRDQRSIIEQTAKKKITEVPQVWALYKEVQDYYDNGMRVPEDVTLLLCDDNWGNIRKLPQPGEPKRAGGYGIYYHFDYVGGPRNYKWVNTNPIERVWEQMHLAYRYGADRLWIVNVGDLKPMEFPISFFLDYAWNPNAIGADQLQAYTEEWCVQQFGKTHAREIAAIQSAYLKYNGRIKPELLNETTYSLNHYNEFGRVVEEYTQLAAQANALAEKLDPSQREAYYQLIQHPVIACANLYELYYNVALNRQAASENDLRANEYAEKAKEHYRKDSLITVDFHQRNNGKWNNMMSQTHIGYTYWQQPPVNKMPTVLYVTEGTTPKPEGSQPHRDAASLVPATATGHVFIEQDHYVSIEADHTSATYNTNGITWTVLPNHGKTGSAITPFPVTASPQVISATSPRIMYEFYSYSEGEAELQLLFSPTLNFHHLPTGMQYGISIDNEEPQVVSLNADDGALKTWEKWVANNIIVKTSAHRIDKPGKHTITLWMIHPGIVLQKMVVNFGGLKPSYLGPPETKIQRQENKSKIK